MIIRISTSKQEFRIQTSDNHPEMKESEKEQTKEKKKRKQMYAAKQKKFYFSKCACLVFIGIFDVSNKPAMLSRFLISLCDCK